MEFTVSCMPCVAGPQWAVAVGRLVGWLTTQHDCIFINPAQRVLGRREETAAAEAGQPHCT